MNFAARIQTGTAHLTWEGVVAFLIKRVGELVDVAAPVLQDVEGVSNPVNVHVHGHVVVSELAVGKACNEAGECVGRGTPSSSCGLGETAGLTKSLQELGLVLGLDESEPTGLLDDAGPVLFDHLPGLLVGGADRAALAGELFLPFEVSKCFVGALSLVGAFADLGDLHLQAKANFLVRVAVHTCDAEPEVP